MRFDKSLTFIIHAIAVFLTFVTLMYVIEWREKAKEQKTFCYTYVSQSQTRIVSRTKIAYARMTINRIRLGLKLFKTYH